jgi:hypothetical protein
MADRYTYVWECSYLTPEQFASLKKFENICKKLDRKGEERITKSIELDNYYYYYF